MNYSRYLTCPDVFPNPEREKVKFWSARNPATDRPSCWFRETHVDGERNPRNVIDGVTFPQKEAERRWRSHRCDIADIFAPPLLLSLPVSFFLSEDENTDNAKV